MYSKDYNTLKNNSFYISNNIKKNNTFSFSRDDTLVIDDVSYTGKEIGDMFEFYKRLKDFYPELNV